ncbi:polycomb protein suz12-like [Corticium candelabrum]|uniref:polycomb protein suz12-like n=1 Tax=Corticium candelabrum TaxID=121492 RepID=UPI002E354BC1|nr:polycomb protein suz12-like [Corticium candelabrum]
MKSTVAPTRGGRQQLVSYEEIRNDYNAFLETYEKPTQIYRYLRRRHSVSPVFLHRNLIYMAKLKKKRHIKRKDFSTLFLNEMVCASAPPPTPVPRVSGSLKITFEGFYEAHDGSQEDSARKTSSKEISVDSFLFRVGYKHGKAAIPQFREIPLGRRQVACISKATVDDTSSGGLTLASLTVPYDMLFHQENDYSCGTLVDYKLVLRVNQGGNSQSAYSKKVVAPLQIIGQQPGINYDELEWDSSSSCSNGDGTEEKSDLVGLQSLVAQLPMSDSSHKLLMPSGRYEVAMCPNMSDSSRRHESGQHLTWESSSSMTTDLCRQLHSHPVLVLSVLWESGDPLYLPSPSVMPTGKWEMPKWALDHYPKKYGWTAKRGQVLPRTNESLVPHQIVFHYLYYGNLRQTETRHNLNCPLCDVKCPMLYSLLKHLQLCHFQFTFTYMLECKVHQVEVKLNTNYQCTDEIQKNVFVCRPVRNKPSMTEFMASSDATTAKGSSIFATPHGRMCYHSATSMPIHVNELDDDSEEELDPEWMHSKMEMMIDEFTDVNDGEKAFMKLWNKHAMKINPYADRHVPFICRDFVLKYAQTIKERNLTRNLALHLASACDFHLISPRDVLECMQIVHNVQQQSST